MKNVNLYLAIACVALVALFVLPGIMSTPTVRRDGFESYDPVKEAQAYSIQIRANSDYANNIVQLDIDRSVMQAKIEALSVFFKTAGVAASIAISAIALAVSLASIVGVYAFYKRAMLASSFVNLTSDYTQPTLIVSSDGWLIDISSGQRALLRSSQDVQALKLQANTQLAQMAMLCNAQAQIAKVTKSELAADALMSSVPMLRGE